MSAPALIDQIRARDPRTIARAATLIENQASEGSAILSALTPHTGQALTIGITGPPGAGKSTLCDQLISKLRAEGKSVAVLAIDPSSPITGGALLGDRIRMQQHHADPNVFIRSMAARGWPGGLAKSTSDLVTLLDAAGFDVIIIETVGVGQSEVEVARLAQVTVLVLTPNSGDDVQSIKAGIIEIAQVFAINKSDLPGADLLAASIHAATAPDDGPAPEIVKVIAQEGRGIHELLAAIQKAAPQKGGGLPARAEAPASASKP